MDLWRVMFLLVVLLAVKVRCVSCPGDMWLETATPAPHLNRSAPLPEPHRNDSCDSHTVSCEPAESNGAKAVVGFNSAVTFFFFVVPMIRVLRLERNSRTKSDTQFWWYLCCGFSGYIVWVYYFSDCSSLYQAAVFPIYMVSILGAIVHFILLCIATYLTLGVRDKRPYALIFVLGSSLIGATLLWVFKVKRIGWLGFSLTALSHCFRFGATNYRDKFTFWLFDVSIPIWVVNAFISVVGSITGFLWLRHPQLCISMEYKVTSYVIGVVRAIEVYLWCSRGMARVLSKIEGEINHV
ncbi:hypothetical protein SETIT_5G292300v2 [Setaria italica]|uniref:Bidirectional sugar transporter SWEET n=1 Tax=Setaria italica TaxID=4555 RepID=K3XKJ5_SETIT|nr:uncharacterized protein LOC101786744 [Setaria italica]XP_022682881.1 uncharacterized protein LOC101786744 [Setaria italica]RCV27023.1 hypothetical protein SETIT_5G292300v2 [Setaria italica]